MLVIFTDLDGTLLDDNYSFNDALEALSLIKSKEIPLVLCSSKSKLEMEYWQDQLGINDPLIVENGGAVFLNGEFGSNEVIKLGTSIKELKDMLIKISKECDSKIKLFSEMSLQKIIDHTGLPIDQARMAKVKNYTEAFIVERGSVEKIKDMIEKKGYNYTRAKRFHYIMKGNDKGKAVKILIDKFKSKCDIVSVGLGDNENDKPMLKVVDNAFMLTDGPKEWNKIVIDLIKQNN